jgi:hypothetical protein
MHPSHQVALPIHGQTPLTLPLLNRLCSLGDQNVAKRVGVRYAMNQGDFNQLPPQTCFELFVAVELVT